MSKLHALYIERIGLLLASNAFNVVGFDVQEFSIRIDETQDQPGAGNAIHRSVLPGNPTHRSIPPESVFRVLPPQRRKSARGVCISGLQGEVGRVRELDGPLRARATGALEGVWLHG